MALRGITTCSTDRCWRVLSFLHRILEMWMIIPRDAFSLSTLLLLVAIFGLSVSPDYLSVQFAARGGSRDGATAFL